MAEGTVDQARELLFTSAPSGAQVEQAGVRLCQTPCSVRQQNLDMAKRLVFRWPDGRFAEVNLALGWNAAALGNVVYGGPAGVLIDTLTGRVVQAPGHVHADAP